MGGCQSNSAVSGYGQKLNDHPLSSEEEELSVPGDPTPVSEGEPTQFSPDVSTIKSISNIFQEEEIDAEPSFEIFPTNHDPDWTNFSAFDVAPSETRAPETDSTDAGWQAFASEAESNVKDTVNKPEVPQREEKFIPERPVGYDNARLPSKLPIVGLGCSSFSTFFWSKNELDQTENSNWTPESMDRSHERVQEWIETIHYAVKEAGITLLDTAPWYGHGTSEVVIGWALEDLQREELVINTKVGRYEADPAKQFDFSREATLFSVQRSIKRMHCKYIDVLQLHDPEFSLSLETLIEETIPAMITCREIGWCKALGMTGYPLEVQHQILQLSLERYGEDVWDQSLTYSHYNLHDMSLFTKKIRFQESQHSSFAAFCQSNSIVLLAAAPLSMGLLTHAGPPDWHPASSALREACRSAALVCKGVGANLSTLALVVALANHRIPCTLLGMKNKVQVAAAAAAAKRFDGVDCTSARPDEILRQVLTENEFDVLQRLRDPVEGPFAGVIDEGYDWDGVQQAIDFWKGVEGVELKEWQAR